MSSPNRIDAALDSETAASIIDGINGLLLFLVDISPVGRKSLPKMRDLDRACFCQCPC